MRHGQLAIHGGPPVRSRPFPGYNTIGAEERNAVNEVLDSGLLSQFLGTWSADFNGGPRVQALEAAWAEHFGARHAISVNSATSGLYAALGAAEIGPGDEVIVSPYTMSASAAGALVYGATPVFADIDPRTYCLDPEAVRRAITPRTRAIVAVDLFGHPADFAELNRIARAHELIVIEDAAQAPGARYRDTWAGRLGDIGVFSLNYHKTIHCGEGGIIVTDNDDLADRVRLIRNHGEAVVKAKGVARYNNLVGFNYRMTEIEAAIAREQLRKLEDLTAPRIEAADFLRERWSAIPGLKPAWVQPGCRHVYYVLALQLDPTVLGVERERFAAALAAEGVPFGQGYVEPLYLQPIYQERDGRSGESPRYPRGLCPVTESMHNEWLLTTPLIHSGLSRADLEDVALAVEKVAAGAAALAAAPAASGVA